VDNSRIENTSKIDPALLLLAALDGRDGGSSLILGQEAAGQRQLVHSDRLPTSTHEGTDEPYLALGFAFGEPDASDPLFRPATLPAGWSKRATDHSMGSEVVDQHGRARVSVFYKAAFYDRRADMYLVQPSGYARAVVWAGGEPVFDEWCTREAFLDAIAKVRIDTVRCLEMNEERDDDYGRTRVAELRNELATIDRFAAQYAVRPGSEG
jgi:hypothetical protein